MTLLQISIHWSVLLSSLPGGLPAPGPVSLLRHPAYKVSHRKQPQHKPLARAREVLGPPECVEDDVLGREIQVPDDGADRCVQQLQGPRRDQHKHDHLLQDVQGEGDPRDGDDEMQVAPHDAVQERHQETQQTLSEGEQ